jgi:hypothetical protein
VALPPIHAPPTGHLKGGGRKRKTGRREKGGNADKWIPPPRGVHISKTAM